MLLAAVSDYLKFWWQLPLLGLFVLLWLVGGAVLMRAALHGVEGLPRVKRTFGHAFLANFMVHGPALLAMGVVAVFIVVLAVRVGPRAMVVLAALVGPLAMLGMSAVILPFYVPGSGNERRGVLLRCTLPILALAAALGAAGLVPAYYARREQVRLDFCRRNLYTLQQALRQYAQRFPGQMPATLEVLHDTGFVSDEELRCPSRGDLAVGYLFLPSTLSESGKAPERIVAWDRPGNHANKRVVLFADKRVEVLDRDLFARQLELPANAQAKAIEEKAAGK